MVRPAARHGQVRQKDDAIKINILQYLPLTLQSKYAPRRPALNTYCSLCNTLKLLFVIFQGHNRFAAKQLH